jgi:ribose-phosphate pyrophosphokinase
MAAVTSPQSGPRRRLEIFSGRGHPELASAIAKCLGIELGEANLRDFPVGEIHCRFDSSIRGSDVFIIQTHCPPINQSIMEQLIMIDAARGRRHDGSSRSVPTTATPVRIESPLGASRSPRSLSPTCSRRRGPTGCVARPPLWTDPGVLRLSRRPPHRDASSRRLPPAQASPDLDLVIVSPDAGRVKVAERISQQLGTDLAFVHKRRPPGSSREVEAMEVIGNVDGKWCVVFDDMIDTAGTICAAAERLVEAGAVDVWAMATHPVLSGPALERLNNSVISRVVVTDTLATAHDWGARQD